MKAIVTKVSTGEVVDESADVVQNKDFRKMRYQLWRKGFMYTPVAGAATEFSERFTQDLWLPGGAYQVKGSDFRDYVEFEVVDLDNILGYGAGLILSRYMETERFKDDEWVPIGNDDASYIKAGLYTRARYVSFGISPVNFFKVRYDFRRL